MGRGDRSIDDGRMLNQSCAISDSGGALSPMLATGSRAELSIDEFGRGEIVSVVKLSKQGVGKVWGVIVVVGSRRLRVAFIIIVDFEAYLGRHGRLHKNADSEMCLRICRQGQTTRHPWRHSGVVDIKERERERVTVVREQTAV